VTAWGKGVARNADNLYGNTLFRTYIRNRESLSAEKISVERTSNRRISVVP